MPTVHLKLGPADHGRPLLLDEYESADYETGHKYEIIDGRLYVVPLPNLPENFLEEWLEEKLKAYSRARPDVIDYVTHKARVFVHGRRGDTCPEPDLAAYANFPRDSPLGELRWQDVSPLVVVEVLVDASPEKELTRNPELYLAVPSVREYWVLDGRANPNEPVLIQRRRYGKRWVVRDYPYLSTFTTRLLPGFSLHIDPRS